MDERYQHDRNEWNIAVNMERESRYETAANEVADDEDTDDRNSDVHSGD